MRVLLDENLPERLTEEFDEDHDARTVGQCGWKGKENGELLGLAERSSTYSSRRIREFRTSRILYRSNLGSLFSGPGAIGFRIWCL